MPSSRVRKKTGAAPPDSPEYQAIQQYIQLHLQMKELNEMKRRLEPQLRALKPLLLGFFGEGGYELIRIDGFSVSTKRVPWVYPASGVSRQTVCEALKLSGLGRFVKEGFDTRSLTAYIRELEEDHELAAAGSDPHALQKLLPLPLAKVIDVRPGFDLQILDRRKEKHRHEETNPEETDPEGDWNEDN